MSADEREKFYYLEEMNKSGLKDNAMIENLAYMMEAGFTNF